MAGRAGGHHPTLLRAPHDFADSDWGLFTIRQSASSHFPDKSAEALFEINRRAISRLIQDGLVKLYWLSGRPATQAEAVVELERFGIKGNRDVVMPVFEDIPPENVAAILAEDSNWYRPSDDRYVAFIATDLGKKAYYAAPQPGASPRTVPRKISLSEEPTQSDLKPP